MTNLIFMGPPGSGKGTQNKFFEQRYHLRPISTGDMFRVAMSEKTPVGVKVKSFIDSGELVPDEVTVGIVRERLKKRDFENGFILDGFPRTIGQAEAFEHLLNELMIKLDRVVLIEVNRQEIVQRLSRRRTCRRCRAVFNVSLIGNSGSCPSCGGELYQRDDDTEEVINTRLTTYESQTLPLKEYYQKRGLLLTVNGAGEPEEIFRSIILGLGLH